MGSGTRGPGPTPAQIASAVAAYMAANPPAGGQNPTPDQISAAVAGYMQAHPLAAGKDGADATPDQIAASVAAYLQANPPAAGKDGKDGANATPTQIAASVATYLQANPPAAGKDGANASDAQVAAQVAAYLTAHPPAAGKDGKDGTNAATFIANVSLGQTATVAISLGIRDVTVPCAGIVKGDKLLAFALNYKLNGGASVTGRPPGYAILDCVCNTDGQVTVSLNAPALSIGASYQITTAIHKVN